MNFGSPLFFGHWYIGWFLLGHRALKCLLKISFLFFTNLSSEYFINTVLYKWGKWKIVKFIFGKGYTSKFSWRFSSLCSNWNWNTVEKWKKGCKISRLCFQTLWWLLKKLHYLWWALLPFRPTWSFVWWVCFCWSSKDDDSSA